MSSNHGNILDTAQRSENRSFRQLEDLNKALMEELATKEQQLESKDEEINRLNELVERKIKESERMREEYRKKICVQVLNNSIQREDDKRKQKQLEDIIMDLQLKRAREMEVSRMFPTYPQRLQMLRDNLIAERGVIEELKVAAQRKTEELEQTIPNFEKRIENLEKEKKKERRTKERVKKMLNEYKQECSRVTGTSQQVSERMQWYASRLDKVEKENEEMRAALQEPRFPMPICQICGFEFDKSPDRTPRMLG